jgi:choline kinase
MKAIILAAGIGQRLGNLTLSKPKCLTKVNGKSILNYNLHNLHEAGFEEVVIVIGYLGKIIVDDIGFLYRDLRIEYVENELYARTNSMYSLWLASEYLKEGVLLIEGDCICEPKIILNTISLPNSKSYWIANKFTHESEGCMLTTDINNKIVDIKIVREKKQYYSENNFKSGGMVQISKELGNNLSYWLDKDIKIGNINIYYDLVLAKNIILSDLYIFSIDGLKWCEIDDVNDLKKAADIFH